MNEWIANSCWRIKKKFYDILRFEVSSMCSFVPDPAGGSEVHVFGTKRVND